MCWPDESRREFSDPTHNTSDQDVQNFLHNVFWVQKLAEITHAKAIHCFAHTPIVHDDLDACMVLKDYSIANCWPYWDRFNPMDETKEPSYARDGVHYGVEHQKRFADLLIERFGHKLK